MFDFIEANGCRMPAPHYPERLRNEFSEKIYANKMLGRDSGSIRTERPWGKESDGSGA
jgi:hypothetical protein